METANPLILFWNYQARARARKLTNGRLTAYLVLMLWVVFTMQTTAAWPWMFLSIFFLEDWFRLEKLQSGSQLAEMGLPGTLCSRTFSEFVVWRCCKLVPASLACALLTGLSGLAVEALMFALTPAFYGVGLWVMRWAGQASWYQRCWFGARVLLLLWASAASVIVSEAGQPSSLAGSLLFLVAVGWMTRRWGQAAPPARTAGSRVVHSACDNPFTYRYRDMRLWPWLLPGLLAAGSVQYSPAGGCLMVAEVIGFFWAYVCVREVRNWETLRCTRVRLSDWLDGWALVLRPRLAALLLPMAAVCLLDSLCWPTLGLIVWTWAAATRLSQLGWLVLQDRRSTTVVGLFLCPGVIVAGFHFPWNPLSLTEAALMVTGSLMLISLWRRRVLVRDGDFLRPLILNKG